MYLFFDTFWLLSVSKKIIKSLKQPLPGKQRRRRRPRRRIPPLRQQIPPYPHRITQIRRQRLTIVVRKRPPPSDLLHLPRQNHTGTTRRRVHHTVIHRLSLVFYTATTTIHPITPKLRQFHPVFGTLRCQLLGTAGGVFGADGVARRVHFAAQRVATWLEESAGETAAKYEQGENVLQNPENGGHFYVVVTVR